jgi:TetR/AcrR family transcriptional regulator
LAKSPPVDRDPPAPEPDAPRASNRGKARHNLLAVARAEFASKGVAGTRVDEIAAIAGVNKQAIYHHFGNKDGLFRATLEAGYEQVKRTNLAYVASDKPLECVKALRHLIEHIFDRFHLHPEMVELVLEENRQKGKHIFDKHLIEDANGPLVACLAETLKRGEREQVFVRGIDSKQVFFDIVSLCMFYFANIYTMSAALGQDYLSAASARARKTHIVKQVTRSLVRKD